MAFEGLLTGPFQRRQFRKEQLEQLAPGIKALGIGPGGEELANQMLSDVPAVSEPAGSIFQGLLATQPGIQGLQERVAEQAVNVADAKPLTKAERIAAQRAGLNFTQGVFGEQLNQEKTAAEIRKLNAEALNIDDEDDFFGNAQQSIATAKTFDQQRQAIDILDEVLQIRTDTGRFLSPAEILANPQTAASLDWFDDFAKVMLLKEQAGDTKLSDQDIIFYQSVNERGILDVLFTGGKINEVALANQRDSMIRSRDLMDAATGGRARLMFPDAFKRIDRSDKGTVLEPRHLGQSIEEEASRAFDAAPGLRESGANPFFPVLNLFE